MSTPTPTDAARAGGLPPLGQRVRRRWRTAWRLFFSAGRTVGWRRMARLAVDRRGSVIQVENTNRCNFHCVYCPTHSPDSTLTVSKGDMDTATFRRIVDANPRARMIHLQGQGEPFLDPGIWDKLVYARERRLFTEIISNGSTLSGRNIEKVVASPLNVLLVSVDVAPPERVEAARRGMNYARVLDGVRLLVERRNQTRSPLVIGIISVFYDADAARVEQALAEFDRIGIDVMLYKQLNESFANRIEGYASQALAEPTARLRRRVGFWMSHQRGGRPAKPCLWLKNDFRYYLNDGRETVCCVLNDGQYATEEWGRERLMEQWASRTLPDECTKCSYFGGYK